MLKTSLPAIEIAQRLNESLKHHNRVILSAPPGAGKSTILPITIFQGCRFPGKIVMLEPRRIAATQVALRMSSLLGESIAGTVGYKVRLESRVSESTRIEVVTEGILSRMMVCDPVLEDVSVLIFDEFHERSLGVDSALAMALEMQSVLRPDLRILIMSATMDTGLLCEKLGADLLECSGKMFPVDVHNSTEDITPETVAEAVAHTVHKVFTSGSDGGDILAFLPSEADIKRCESILSQSISSAVSICPLYGMMPLRMQAAALERDNEGRRKIILSTPIAETSLTIEGVTTAVDSGFYRRLVFNPGNGMSHLETVRISMDMAVQRTGRAGRLRKGTCYRLWTVAMQQRMSLCRKPEILDADFASTALAIAAWGESNPLSLPWITPPPDAIVSDAVQLLHSLGATTADGRITQHGRAMAALPCHPRIAQMLLQAKGHPDLEGIACDVAALLEDGARNEDGSEDITALLQRLHHERMMGRSSKSWNRIILSSKQLRRLLNFRQDSSAPDPYLAGALIAAAYPDRIGKASGCGEFLLSGGGKASADKNGSASSYDFLAICDLSMQNTASGKIHLAAPVDKNDLLKMAVEKENVSWNPRSGGMDCKMEYRIGCLTIDSKPLTATREQVIGAIVRAAPKEGRSMFDFSDDFEMLLNRIGAAASWHPELDIPELSVEALSATASQWLPDFIGNASKVQELRKIDMTQVALSRLDYTTRQAVERIAPSHIVLPSGKRVRVEYRTGADKPIVRVRLQECFGMKDTPLLDNGRRPVLMELLSPGFKPVQLTDDMRSFWENTYFEVRKELRRRYPKHSWPDDPSNAAARMDTGLRTL